jgi:phenylacetate-CoA ligase
VYDYYGSREIGAMAAECEEHNGFHISAENVAMEFLRDGEQVSEESGLIYVTNLRNYGMPFIRYEIGDVGKPSLESCSCGRGLPMIESLEGRASQFMAVRDKDTGKIIPVSTAAPGIIGNLLMYVPVNSYRIVQESLEKIVIQVVAGEEYSQKDTDFLVNHLNEYLRGRITVEVNKVDYLPPLPSGKRSVFISKINAFHTE